MTHTKILLNYQDMNYLNNPYDDYEIYNNYKILNTYTNMYNDCNNDFNSEYNAEIYTEIEKLNSFLYNLNTVAIFLILYSLSFYSVYYLHKIDKSFYIGNTSFRQYYPFYINIFQKVNEHKEFVVTYLKDKSLQDLIKINIDQDSLRFINLRSYYYARQNYFHKKLFHYGDNNYIRVIDIDGYKTSIGELNYIIWLIESGLYTFFTKKRTLLENKQKNIGYNYLFKKFIVKDIFYPILSFFNDSYNGMYMYFQNKLERQSYIEQA